MKTIHEAPSDLAGKTVKIKSTATHFQDPTFGGSEFRVEDWWDRIAGESWGSSKGNPACMVYALRINSNKLPSDDEVLYGKIGALGHLVHISELEGAQ